MSLGWIGLIGLATRWLLRDVQLVHRAGEGDIWRYKVSCVLIVGGFEEETMGR